MVSKEHEEFEKHVKAGFKRLKDEHEAYLKTRVPKDVSKFHKLPSEKKVITYKLEERTRFSSNKKLLEGNIDKLKTNLLILSELVKKNNKDLRDEKISVNILLKLINLLLNNYYESSVKLVLKKPEKSKLIYRLFFYQIEFKKLINQFKIIVNFISNFYYVINYIGMGNEEISSTASSKLNELKSIINSINIKELKLGEKISELKDITNYMNNLNKSLINLAQVCKIYYEIISKIKKGGELPRYMRFLIRGEVLTERYLRIISKDKSLKDIDELLDKSIENCKEIIIIKSLKDIKKAITSIYKLKPREMPEMESFKDATEELKKINLELAKIRA